MFRILSGVRRSYHSTKGVSDYVHPIKCEPFAQCFEIVDEIAQSEWPIR